MKISDCDCLILCGGLGTRLQNVIGKSQKVMAEVNGTPFLNLILKHLKDQGIDRVVLCTGYKADSVENYYRDHDFGLTIDFSREDEPLGTGGAVKNAQDIVSSNPFFVLNGDSFLPIDYRAFLDFHAKKGALASIVTSRVSQSKDFGSLQMDDSKKITGFSEKANNVTESLVNAGIYCFDQEIFSLMPEEAVFSLENDLFPVLVGKQFYGYPIKENFIDIGTPQRYETAGKQLKEGKSSGH